MIVSYNFKFQIKEYQFGYFDFQRLDIVEDNNRIRYIGSVFDDEQFERN